MVACQEGIFLALGKASGLKGSSYRCGNPRNSGFPTPFKRRTGFGMTGFWSFLECGEAGSRFRCGFGMREFAGAVGAELVGVGDFALALRAGGMQIAFAVGAEIEASRNRRRAL